ncbi:MAG: MYXO-CTERM sorting domain-containing protein [Myxococcota bacterium]
MGERRAVVRRALTWPGAGRLVLVGLTLVGVTGFSTPALFSEPVVAGGGGGRLFTGSARDGFGCDVCHQGAVAPALEVEGLPEAWVAGATYTLWLNWSAGSGAASFVGEFVDEQGWGVGSLATPPADLVEQPERCASGTLAVRLSDVLEGARTVFAIPACGASSARVQWTAPSDDAEEASAWLHLGFVHGDDSDTPDGDGVTMIAREIPSAASRASAEGCRVAGTGPRAPWWFVLVAGAWVVGRGRRRR